MAESYNGYGYALKEAGYAEAAEYIRSLTLPMRWGWWLTRALLIFQNTAAFSGRVNIKVGNGFQATKDACAKAIAASGVVCAVIESGSFKNVSGTNKNKVLVIPSSADIKTAMVLLL